MLRPAALLAGLLLACGPAAPAPSPSPQPSAPAGACHQAAVVLCELNPAVTQATIGTTICVAGWSASVRPASSYTDALKQRQMVELSLPGTAHDYEEDHRMPLALGGAPRDVHNLSPEAGLSNPKDRDESSLHADVCTGRATLADAQAALVAKWLAAWPGYLNPA